MSDLDFEKLVSIDPLALDKECINLPSDYLKVANAAADAKRLLEKAKSSLEVLEANLSKTIRSEPTKYGLDKVTESAIRELVLTCPEHVEATAKLNKLRHQSELHQAAVWAMEHKKKSLSLLVELHLLGYTAGVKLSKEAKDAVDQSVKELARRARTIAEENQDG
jgi:hypothetical protein